MREKVVKVNDRLRAKEKKMKMSFSSDAHFAICYLLVHWTPSEAIKEKRKFTQCSAVLRVAHARRRKVKIIKDFFVVSFRRILRCDRLQVQQKKYFKINFWDLNLSFLVRKKGKVNSHMLTYSN